MGSPGEADGAVTVTVTVTVTTGAPSQPPSPSAHPGAVPVRLQGAPAIPGSEPHVSHSVLPFTDTDLVSTC